MAHRGSGGNAASAKAPELGAIGIGAALLTILIWSGNTIATKASDGVIAPASIAFYRWLIALVVLTPFAAGLIWRHRRESLPLLPKLFTLSMLGMVIFQSLAYEAAKTTTAINMGVLISLMPLLQILLASVLASERLSTARIGGGILSLCGLVYLTARGDLAVLTAGGFHVGDLLMIVAVVANSLYGVLLRRWAIALPMWLQLWWQILFATVTLLPLWLLSDISPITTQNLPIVLYAAIPTSLLAPFGWILAIRNLGAARSAPFINLLPVLVAVLAWTLLGERLAPYHLIGGGLTLIGVIIGMRPVRTRT